MIKAWKVLCLQRQEVRLLGARPPASKLLSLRNSRAVSRRLFFTPSVLETDSGGEAEDALALSQGEGYFTDVDKLIGGTPPSHRVGAS